MKFTAARSAGVKQRSAGYVRCMGRRVTGTLAAITLVVFFSSLAASGNTSSGIKGVLLNTTCPGPCLPPCPPCVAQPCPERSSRAGRARPCPAIACPDPCVPTQSPQPYTGPDAHVVVRRVSSGRVVARRAPTDGHFRVRLAPGAYRVHGYVAESCWVGQTQRAVVHAEHFTRLHLAVHNDCVLAPQPAARR
jgi:hypothetical protein